MRDLPALPAGDGIRFEAPVAAGAGQGLPVLREQAGDPGREGWEMNPIAIGVVAMFMVIFGLLALAPFILAGRLEDRDEEEARHARR